MDWVFSRNLLAQKCLPVLCFYDDSGSQCDPWDLEVFFCLHRAFLKPHCGAGEMSQEVEALAVQA